MNLISRASLCAVILCLLPDQSPAAETEKPAGGKLLTLRDDVDVKKLGILESYDEAIALEKEIAQMYREIRAAKLAQIQRQTLSKSLRDVLLPISDRMTPDAEVLNSKAQNADQIKAYQQALKKLMQENDAIVSNSEELLKSLLPEPIEPEETTEETPEESTPDATESAESAEASQEQLEQLAEKAEEMREKAEDSMEAALEEMNKAAELVDKKLEQAKATAEATDNEEAKQQEQQQEQLKEKLESTKKTIAEALKAISEEKEDLGEKLEQAREAIKLLEESLPKTSAVDKELAAAKQLAPQAHTAKAMEHLKAAQADIKAAAAAMAQEPNNASQQAGGTTAQQEIEKQKTLERLAHAAAGKYLDISEQMKGGGLDVQAEAVSPELYPPSINQFYKGVSGRKLVKAGGIPAIWFHVNKWYILGPYDNAGRINIQRVYPPESIVDLDAQYPGRHGKTLTWGYDSFVGELIVPATAQADYTIHYGYTELFFEEAADLWIAIGSDDRSDLWINDMPVWHSSNQLKNWNREEGLRKVHFKKGRNKVVFRLENGWSIYGFSLLINTQGANPTGGGN